MVDAMSEVRAILLDLDGTIADSIDFFCGLSGEVLSAAGISLPGRAALVEAIAFGIPPASRFLPADYPDREAFLLRLYEARWPEWIQRYGSEVKPLPGACEAVAALAGRGVPIGLVTSSAGELPFLERWGIRRHFAIVVSRDAVRRVKPDPEPLLTALEGLGVAAVDAVSVGDTPVDVRAGRAAGVRTVGVLTGAGTAAQLRAEGVEAILTSIAELPRYLDDGRHGESA